MRCVAFPLPEPFANLLATPPPQLEMSDRGPDLADPLRADARTRTGDPFITSEVLYQLSYVGGIGAL